MRGEGSPSSPVRFSREKPSFLYKLSCGRRVFSSRQNEGARRLLLLVPRPRCLVFSPPFAADPDILFSIFFSERDERVQGLKCWLLYPYILRDSGVAFSKSFLPTSNL